MPERFNITLDTSLSGGDTRIDIEIDSYTATPSGAQDITFVDGGDFTSVIDESSYTAELRLENMGLNDNQPDRFRFDLSSFNEDFDISITSEGPEDAFLMSGFTSYLESGGVYTFNYVGSDGRTYRVRLDPGDAAVNFVCFSPGTPIDTPSGPIDVAHLQAGDLVVTRDRGVQPIRHMLTRKATFSSRDSIHKPILLTRGCFGHGAPSQDLVVSPQHRVLLTGDLCTEMFGAPEVLAPAKGLIDLRGVRQKKGLACVEYIALVLDRHEIVTAAGYPCETLLLAPYTLATLPKSHRDALDQDLPALAQSHAAPARPLLTVKEAQRWAQVARIHAKSLAA